MNIIGLDIGGTKITGIVFNGKKTIKVINLPTPKSLASFKATVKKLVETLSAGIKIDAVGIGMAGIVDHKKNIVVYSPNLPFIQNLNFQELLGQIKKIKVDNDANCFARAESKLGQGKDFKNFVGVTLGTGIGGGIVSEGQLVLGSHGMAGEVGGMSLDLDNTFEYSFQKAKNASNYKQIGKIIGALLVNVFNLLDVEAIILGGTVAIKNHEKFLTPVIEMLNKRYAKRNIKYKVLVSKLENPGAVGAALMFLK